METRSDQTLIPRSVRSDCRSRSPGAPIEREGSAGDRMKGACKIRASASSMKRRRSDCRRVSVRCAKANRQRGMPPGSISYPATACKKSEGNDVAPHRNDPAAQHVPVLRRQSRRHAGESYHRHHVLAVLALRQDLDNRQSDGNPASYVIDLGEPVLLSSLASIVQLTLTRFRPY